MDSKSYKEKWEATMIAKHGSLEAASEFLRKSAANSKRNTGGKGGFAHMKQNDPERFKQISTQAGQKSGKVRAKG